NYRRSETRQEFRPARVPKVLATFATSKSDVIYRTILTLRVTMRIAELHHYQSCPSVVFARDPD
ncbi:MAG: hypothetical protein CMJ64_16085, partial [Planctomycetaceae bacterium]|nr:hypothetical protein [Planctomycetaceae bacterium]